jgi:hypothetical protein
MPFTLPNHFMVQARFGREVSGADPVINTFVFEGQVETANASIRDRLDQFYTGLATGQGTSLRARMSVDLSSLVYNIRPADAGVGFPGTEVPSLLWTPPAIANRLPMDCCIAISYRAAAPFTARRRGRIYLGPLAINAIDASGTAPAAVITDFSAAAKGLASVSVANPVLWKIASRVGNSAAEIKSGFVDKHLDTQRRRDPGTEFFGRRPDTWSL